MQTNLQSVGSPKAKSESYRSRHRERPAYVAPQLARVVERIGTGASRSLKYGLVDTVQQFYAQHAIDWHERGYTVEWHDCNRWFIATCEGKPTVFCALTEAE